MYLSHSIHNHILTLFPQVMTFCHLILCLLMLLGSLYCKQYGPRPDCSIRSRLIWVHSVCSHDQKKSEVHLNICSRCKKQRTLSGQKYNGRLRVNPLYNNEFYYLVAYNEPGMVHCTHKCESRGGGGGGQGVQTPTGKSQVIWVSIGNKQMDPPGKSWTPPLENVGPPLANILNKYIYFQRK